MMQQAHTEMVTTTWLDSLQHGAVEALQAYNDVVLSQMTANERTDFATKRIQGCGVSANKSAVHLMLQPSVFRLGRTARI